MHSDNVKRRKQLARIGAYYIVIRTYLMDIHNRSVNKKSNSASHVEDCAATAD